MKGARYSRIAAIAPIVIQSDYIPTLADSPHQIQVCVRIGRGQVDGHDRVLRQRKTVVPRVSARTVLRGAFASPAPALRTRYRWRQRTKIDDARIHHLIHPRPDDRLDPNHVRLQGRLPQQPNRHIRFEVRLPLVPNRNPVPLQEIRRRADVLQRIDGHPHGRLVGPGLPIVPRGPLVQESALCQRIH